jgi:iron complex outermembrane receptor protein
MKMPSRPRVRRWTTILVLLLQTLPGRAQDSAESPQGSAAEFKKLSLAELMEIEVVSVSRRLEKLSESPSAIQVITAEDVRRSGASSLPEALRLADNLTVAQKSANAWAITARGFNTDLANKLLVLIDGRTVYTPLFSGVFWDRQDVLLEDLQRIEVISGPGGTLWGANAVNGVINVITRNAADSQGLYLEGGAGTNLRAFTGLRYGGKLGSSAFFRVYGKYFDRDGQVFPDGRDAGDSSRMGQGGFRIDSLASGANTFTLQGDAYGGDLQQATGGESNVSGGNLLGRWSRVFSTNSNTTLQVYYDRTHLSLPVPASMINGIPLAPAGRLKDDLDTLDFDFQHRLTLSEKHRVVWGLGYRFTHDVVENAPALAFEPPRLDRNLFSAFAQDEIAVRPRLALTLGTKVEHNDYTGFEVEPSVRLRWTASDNTTLWAAASRAIRAPSRVDRHERLPTPGFAPLVQNLLIGGADFASETLVAWEAGLRVQLGQKVSASLSTFFNQYDHVRSTATSPPPAVLGLPLVFKNDLEAETYGLELSGDYQPAGWWRLHAGYAYLHGEVRVRPGGTDFNNALNETADPKHQGSLRSSMNLPRGVELDLALRAVSSFLYNTSGVPAEVPGYTEADAQLTWHATKKLTLSVIGRNLLHPQHLEYVISSPNPREEIERSVLGKVTVRW